MRRVRLVSPRRPVPEHRTVVIVGADAAEGSLWDGERGRREVDRRELCRAKSPAGGTVGVVANPMRNDEIAAGRDGWCPRT